MKKLMDGYVGVKFRAVKDTDCLVPEGFKDLFREFKDNADRLKNHGMTPRNGALGPRLCCDHIGLQPGHPGTR